MRTRTGLLVLVVGAVAVLLLTLGPLPRTGLTVFTRLVDGTASAVGLAPPGRTAAEALGNLVLLLPLGMALAVLRPRWRAVVTVAVLAAVSVLIELAQTALPGRTTSARDVVLNAAGAAVGVLLVRLARYRTRTVSTPTPPTDS